MNPQDESKELVTNDDTKLDFRNLDEIQAFGDRIAKSGLTPIKEGKDVMVAILLGRELGMPPMISVSNIYPINGKGTLSVHMINALLQKAGVVVEVLRDYEPCVYFGFKGEDGKILKNLDGSPVILREGFADEPAKEHEVKANKIVNYRTILRFTRRLKQPDGTWKDMTITSTYSLQEATIAGLAGNPKREPWIKYPKQMCLNRTLAFGGRLIASDVLLGMYETSEMADAVGLNYKGVEDGKITILESYPANKSEQITQPFIEDVKEESSESNVNKNSSTKTN